jgi:hypothetical protein
MSIGMFMDWQGISSEQYDRIREAVEAENELTVDLEALLSDALRPVEPPESLSERIETTLVTKDEVDEPPAGLQIEDVLEEPPTEPGPHQIQHRGKPAKIDWAGRDEANRRLGASGEKFVAELERCHLSAIGKTELADRVEIIAQTKGDGAGYDVHSFFEDGKDKFIEVKTWEDCYAEIRAIKGDPRGQQNVTSRTRQIALGLCDSRL